MSHDSYGTLDRLLSQPTPLWIVLLAIIYTALVITVRWHMIARPLRNQLDVRERMILAEAKSLQGNHEDLGKRILALFPDHRRRDRFELLDALFWSRGKETASWLLIDKAESWLVDTWNLEKLLARLTTIHTAIRRLDDPAARDLRGRLEARLRVPHSLDPADLRELYKEALRVQRESLVRYDVDHDSCNNKILWHIIISLMAIVLVANIGPGAAQDMGWMLTAWRGEGLRALFIMLLLAGAIGGILSRLTRALRDPSSRVEGLSWMAMFLSPLAGALAGWAGGMVLLAAQQLKLVLTDLDTDKLTILLLGAAVLLGFSERLLTQIAGRLDQHLVPQQPRVEGSARGRGRGGKGAQDQPPSDPDRPAAQVH